MMTNWSKQYDCHYELSKARKFYFVDRKIRKDSYWVIKWAEPQWAIKMRIKNDPKAKKEEDKED